MTEVDLVTAAYDDAIERARRVMPEVVELAELVDRLEWQCHDLSLGDDSPEFEAISGRNLELTALLDVMCLALENILHTTRHSGPVSPAVVEDVLGQDVVPPGYRRWFDERARSHDSLVGLGRILEREAPDGMEGER